MKVISTPIADCQVLYLDRFPDARGGFLELYNERRYAGSHLARAWKQINCSHSRKNVVRGIHVAPFGKLVSCVRGRVFDVVVDLRRDSPSYLRWHGEVLSAENAAQVYVPPHCGHGFMALESDSIVLYAQTAEYDPGVESSIHWRDETIGIAWPPADEYILSPKDQQAPRLKRSQ